MTTWLHRRRTSANPWPSRMRQTSRPERTRSLPMRDVEPGDEDLAPQVLLDLGGVRAFEEKLHRFPEVGRGFFHGGALTRHVQLGAEGHVAVAVALHDGSEAHRALCSLRLGAHG